MNKKTVIYVRVSTADQTTASQEAELKAYCDRMGWKADVVRDKITGSKFDRVGLNALRVECRLGMVERIVCFKIDRLGRSLIDMVNVCEELKKNGVAIIAPSQGIDTSNNNPAAQFQFNVLMAVAEFERSLIRERVLAGMATARAQGKVISRLPQHSVTKEQFKAYKLAHPELSCWQIARRLKMPGRSAERWFDLLEIEKQKEQHDSRIQQANTCPA